jgi:hypothetical protein
VSLSLCLGNEPAWRQLPLRWLRSEQDAEVRDEFVPTRKYNLLGDPHATGSNILLDCSEYDQKATPDELVPDCRHPFLEYYL